MKYYGFRSKQNFIDELKAGEMCLAYKEASYDIWLDGLGNCIAMTTFGGCELTEEEHEATLKAYETVEELVDDYVFYDGVKLSEVLEMDTEDY